MKTLVAWREVLFLTERNFILFSTHQQKHPLSFHLFWVGEITFSPTNMGENAIFEIYIDWIRGEVNRPLK